MTDPSTEMSELRILGPVLAVALGMSADSSGGRVRAVTIETGEPAIEIEFPYHEDLRRWISDSVASDFQHQLSDTKPMGRWLIKTT